MRVKIPTYFCSETLISAWGSFICRKPTTRDPRLYFPSEGSRTQDFYALKNPSTSAGFEPANLGSNGEYDNHGNTGVDKMSLTSAASFYDKTTLFTRPLHVTTSPVQINDVLHSNYPYLLIWVVIATELLSNEIFAANGMVYTSCILKHSTVNLIIRYIKYMPLKSIRFFWHTLCKA